MFLREDVAHIDVGIWLFRIQYPFDLHVIVDQLEHSIVVRIFQRFANTAQRDNSSYHVDDSHDHQDARQQENDPNGPVLRQENARSYKLFSFFKGLLDFQF